MKRFLAFLFVATIAAGFLTPPLRAQQAAAPFGLAPLGNLGLSTSHKMSAATTSPTLVVANTTQAVHALYGYNIVNTNSTTAYLKFYDVAAAPSPCGVGTPILVVPLYQNIPVTKVSLFGRPLANGLAYCVTGAIADADTTNATTGISIDVVYK